MTNEQKMIINRLMRTGKGYRTIAREVDLPVNSVKSWCHRHPVDTDEGFVCLFCGRKLQQTKGKRQRKFCSDSCRMMWWSSHPESRNVKTVYHHICRFCGREFINSRIKASYCGRACFAKARMKGERDG